MKKNDYNENASGAQLLTGKLLQERENHGEQQQQQQQQQQHDPTQDPA